jgi:hypothetical protein
MTSGTSGVHIAPCPSATHPSWGRGPVNNEEASSPTINSVQAYPNPAINDIYLTIPIQWQNKALVVEIFNPAGQIILKSGISNGSQIENIRTATLRPGYYIMKISCEGQTAIQKIIKQ